MSKVGEYYRELEEMGIEEQDIKRHMGEWVKVKYKQWKKKNKKEKK